MAVKLVRYTLNQFGATVNPASEVGEFGSGANGLGVYTGAITLMQSLANWSRGWAAETIANNRPFLEDMNAVDCVFGYYLCYLMQEGIPEYDAGTNYFINSICQSGGLLYQVLNDNGAAGISGTAPTNMTYWRQFTAPAPYIKIVNAQNSGTSGGTATAQGSWVTASFIPFNTISTDTGSNVISLNTGNGGFTLQAGTYDITGSFPFHETSTSQIRLYNVTAGAVVNDVGGSAMNGTSVQNGSSDDTPLNSLMGRFTIAAGQVLQMQYQVSMTKATDGLGVAGSFGQEIFGQIVLTRIS